MRMREIGIEGREPLESYGPGGFRIGGVWYPGARFLGPAGHLAVALPLGAAAIAPALAAADDIDILLIGMGAEIAPLDPALRDPLEDVGIGVEPMATPPACRTYTVLLSEGRRLAALLIPV